MRGSESNRIELLHKMVDGAPVSMIVVDAVGTITFCSDVAERLFGFSPEELVGTNMLDYVDLEWNPLALESIGSAMAGSGLRMPMLFRIRDKHGGTHIVEVTANSQMDDPDVQGMVVYIRSWDEQALIDDIIEALAADRTLESKFDMFVAVMGAETLDAVGAVLFDPHDGAFTRAVASPALDKRLGSVPATTADTGPAPWDAALRSGEPQWIPCEQLDAERRELAAARGFQCCWAYPVLDPSGSVQACLVLWRTDPRPIEESYLMWIRRLARLTQLVLEQDASRARLSHAATHDPLTGLPNRAAFFDHFQDLLGTEGSAPFLGVLYLDLDGFKPVNDSLGHGAGDAVLVAIGRRFSARLRDGDMVARMGGDEFAVVCPSVDSLEDLESLADRLASAAREPVHIGDHVVQVGASVGVCMAAWGSCSIDALLDAADAALYDVKANDKGGFRLVSITGD